VKQGFLKYQHMFKKMPRKVWIIGGVVLSVLLAYGLLFFIPQKIAFSYAGESCASQLVLFPSAQSARSDEFEINPRNELKIGSFAYAATEVCATPKQAPEAGSHLASIGLFGGWFMPKLLSVDVPQTPVVRTDAFIGKKISTALPLKVPITSDDTLHTYTLVIADKTTPCRTEAGELTCAVDTLGLQPGSECYRSV
jgi:hypothetical protein